MGKRLMTLGDLRRLVDLYYDSDTKDIPVVIEDNYIYWPTYRLGSGGGVVSFQGKRTLALAIRRHPLRTRDQPLETHNETAH